MKIVQQIHPTKIHVAVCRALGIRPDAVLITAVYNGRAVRFRA